MFKSLFKFFAFAVPTILTNSRGAATESELDTRGLPDYNTSYGSRELLTNSSTNTPTAFPTLSRAFPAYMVNNNAYAGASSFPGALSYVDSIGGVHNLTFGSGAYNQTCNLASSVTTYNPITFDLSGMSYTGFTLDGGNNNYGILNFGSSVAMTFTSSTVGGRLSFASSQIYSKAPSDFVTTISAGSTLYLSRGSFFENVGDKTARAMITFVNSGSTLDLSGNSYLRIATQEMVL